MIQPMPRASFSQAHSIPLAAAGMSRETRPAPKAISARQLEVKDGLITGKIKGINCYGPEKESRIRAAYMLKDFDEILAYGDSEGDREMLALASKKFYRPFRDSD